MQLPWVHPDAHGPRKNRRAGDREDPGRLKHGDTRAYKGGTPGRLLQETVGPLEKTALLLMDQACGDDQGNRIIN